MLEPLTGAPIRFVFLLLGPLDATKEHLDSLAHIARLMSDDEFPFPGDFCKERSGVQGGR